MGFVEALEFGFHEFHVVLLGDHAVFIGVHEEKELLDVIFAEGEAILGLGDGIFLRSGGAEEGDGGEEDDGADDEPDLVEMYPHAELLEVGIPGMEGMYNGERGGGDAKNRWKLSGILRGR